MANELFSPTTLWPDLFDGLSEREVFDITNIIGMGHQEGWNPTREETENLILAYQGKIDAAEQDRRARAIAAQRVASLDPVAASA
ncbi:MAG: hypothetical protein QM621_02040 [Aeromicrobium sp.]|uniref:hypothetical protein n=1 Tax=Aeromicrobium sp. TaxID=1871063 RepID=UPI0039E454E9